MFKKSSHINVDPLSGVSSLLEGKTLDQYNNEQGWHNQFRLQIVSRIDESVFKVLYSEKMGAPNFPVSVLVGMLILKDAFGWSDSQLFEHCRFNLLVRSALGLFKLTDEIPTESTYYLFRQRMHQYNREQDEDLLQRTFDKVTAGQLRDFKVSGRSIRMDSKLFGSNIAYFSRYEIIHQTFILFCKTLNDSDLGQFSEQEKQQVKSLQEEEPIKTIYRSTKDHILVRMQELGMLIYKTLHTFSIPDSEPYKLLERVFDEQYRVKQEPLEVLLRPKEEMGSGSVQSPHDPDSAFRQKSDQKVKGYSVNITETTSDGPLDLITNVIVDKANVPDTNFVQPAITATQALTGMKVETVYADGAFQSPDNDHFCHHIDMVFTGIQGSVSRYDLEMTPDGLLVTDTQTAECHLATLAKKQKNSKEDKWVINTGQGKVYFNQQAIRTSNLRRIMKQRPIEETQNRNNVESTIFHFGYSLRNSKSKYRGLIKNQVWAICRCLWVNLVRIMHFLEQICQRTVQKSRKTALLFNFSLRFRFYGIMQSKSNPATFLICNIIFFLKY